MALAEVREAMPDARTAKVRKSARGAREALDVLACRRMRRRGRRPRTAIDGLFLAGDWIDTGLPATIESAVMSGHRAARAGVRMTAVLVHYSEVALKGKNRSWFVGRLVRNIHGALAGLHIKEVRTPIGRIEIVLGQDQVMPEVLDRLSRIFGIPTIRSRRACRSISKAWPTRSCRGCRRKESVKSFRVFVRRSDQKFPTPSPRAGARARLAGLDGARLEGRSRSCRSGDQRRDHSRRGVLLHGTADWAPAACRSAPAGDWSRCCPAALIRRWPRGA